MTGKFQSVSVEFFYFVLLIGRTYIYILIIILYSFGLGRYLFSLIYGTHSP